MTDDRMPHSGTIGETIFNDIVGFAVAVFLLGSRGALWAAQAMRDRRLERAEARDARREKARQAWDEFGCDVWSDDA